ncbi:unnamed protein product, partial [Urochloa humidicola]
FLSFPFRTIVPPFLSSLPSHTLRTSDPNPVVPIRISPTVELSRSRRPAVPQAMPPPPWATAVASSTSASSSPPPPLPAGFPWVAYGSGAGVRGRSDSREEWERWLDLAAERPIGGQRRGEAGQGRWLMRPSPAAAMRSKGDAGDEGGGRGGQNLELRQIDVPKDTRQRWPGGDSASVPGLPSRQRR